jgi:hypothetical protein
VLTNPPSGTAGDDDVALSPDEKWVAFRRVSEAAVHDIYVLPVRVGRRSR